MRIFFLYVLALVSRKLLVCKGIHRNNYFVKDLDRLKKLGKEFHKSWRQGHNRIFDDYPRQAQWIFFNNLRDEFEGIIQHYSFFQRAR